MNFGRQLDGFEEYTPFRYEPGMIRLDANESCSDMPDEMKIKVLAAIREQSFNRYPDAFATDLCKAFADYHGLDAENVLAGNGSDELLVLIFSVMVPANSKVLVLTPDFSVYSIYATLYGRQVISLTKNEDLNFRADDVIECAKRNNVGLIIFSNPCNPTGQGITAAEVEKIVSSVDCAVCADEAYMDFWPDNETVMPLINQYDNLFVLRTCSKALGSAAFRIGFVVANTKIVSMFRKAKVPYNVSALSQTAGTVALKNKEYLRNLTNQLISRKERLYEMLKSLERPEFTVINTKTNFIVCLTPYAPQIYEFLKENNVIVRLIGKGILRITAGTRGENDILKTKLEAAFIETGIY